MSLPRSCQVIVVSYTGQDRAKLYHVLDIHSLDKVQANNTNGRRIFASPMQATSHIQRLPFRAHAQFPRLASTKRPPIPCLLLRIQKLLQMDRHVTDDGILHEVAVVDNLDCDDRRLAIRAQELFCGFPDGAGGVLETRSLVDHFLSTEEYFSEGVQVLSHGLGGVEFLGLMDGKPHDTHSYKGR